MINLQPYADPQYFGFLLLALVPLVIGLLRGHRWRVYETVVSLAFITLMFTGAKWHQAMALIGFLIWELLVVSAYAAYRQQRNQTSVFVGSVVAAIVGSVT
jgi:membrane protein involved in D-alanine export